MDASRYREPDAAALEGTVFDGRYRLVRLLGMGGMGAVYEAVQLAVDRPVAIKVLKPGLARDLRDVARFQQEARAVAALSHPNTIRLFDFGQVEDGSLFLVMELLRGETLEDLIAREAPLAPARAAAIGLQVAEALVEAHAHGIVHRDLKPPNLFLAEVLGRQDFVKVLDFGIAKVSGDRAADSPLTSTGVAVGSPRWIAPEQATGEPVTGQADIYTLGVILYEMLTGRSLFTGRTATDLLVAHLRAPAPAVAVEGRVLSGPLPDLVAACLEKLPSARPQGAMEVVEALRAMHGQHITAASHVTAPGPQVPKPPRAPRGPTREIVPPRGEPARSPAQTGQISQPASIDPAAVGIRTTAFTGPIEEVALTSPVPALGATGPITSPRVEPTLDNAIPGRDPHLSHSAHTQSLPAESAPGTTGDMPAYTPAPDLGDDDDLAPTRAVPLVSAEIAAVSLATGREPHELATDPGATAQHAPPSDASPRNTRLWLAAALALVLVAAVYALWRPASRPPATSAPTAAVAPPERESHPTAQRDPAPERPPEIAPEPERPPELAPEPERPPELAQQPESPPETAETPAEPPAQLLRTRLASSPSGAKVYEGELPVGETPLDYEWLASTPPPTLIFRAQGRVDAEVEPAALVAGGETLVRLRRLPRRPPPSRPAPSPYERTP
ncbi:MAG: protein kinase [Myxococcota bacterium]